MLGIKVKTLAQDTTKSPLVNKRLDSIKKVEALETIRRVTARTQELKEAQKEAQEPVEHGDKSLILLIVIGLLFILALVLFYKIADFD